MKSGEPIVWEFSIPIGLLSNTDKPPLKFFLQDTWIQIHAHSSVKNTKLDTVVVVDNDDNNKNNNNDNNNNSNNDNDSNKSKSNHEMKVKVKVEGPKRSLYELGSSVDEG